MSRQIWLKWFCPDIPPGDGKRIAQECLCIHKYMGNFSALRIKASVIGLEKMQNGKMQNRKKERRKLQTTGKYLFEKRRNERKMAIFRKAKVDVKAGRSQEQNQNLMKLIKRVHSVVEHEDIQKHRQSQDSFGALLGNSREMDIESVEVEGMHCEWVRVRRPHTKRRVILYCHGGGYSTGSCIYARTLTTKLAAAASMDVFCFDYRLAPENPYPAAPQDAMKAWDYLMLQGFGAADVIVAGDSAGGNLALSLVLTLKEQGRFLPRGLVLLSPWTDLTASGKSHESRAEVDPVLDAEYLHEMTENYAHGADCQDPHISPLFADFTGFPAAYIQVGDNEVLLSDSSRLQKNMHRAGVPVRLDVFEGMWHVFQMSPFKTAMEAMDRCAEFILEICG